MHARVRAWTRWYQRESAVPEELESIRATQVRFPERMLIHMSVHMCMYKYVHIAASLRAKTVHGVHWVHWEHGPYTLPSAIVRAPARMAVNGRVTGHSEAARRSLRRRWHN